MSEIKPYDGGVGVACMPTRRNVIAPASINWRLVHCPQCNSHCWESEILRELLKTNSDIKALCTECALKVTIGAVR